MMQALAEPVPTSMPMKCCWRLSILEGRRWFVSEPVHSTGVGSEAGESFVEWDSKEEGSKGLGGKRRGGLEGRKL